MAKPTDANGAGAVAALSPILDRQRQALVQGDLGMLMASTEELARALSALQAAGPLRSPAEVRALSAARSASRVNSELLHRAAGSNARALSTLFEAPSTYGPGGSGRLGRASRTLDAA